MLLVIGALGILMGMCTGVVVLTFTAEQFQIASEQFAKNASGVPRLSASVLRILYTAVAVASLGVGAILIVLGIFVRRASKVASVFAIILCGLALLYLCVNELALVLGALGNPIIAVGACVFLVPIILLGLTTMWLMQVLKGLPHIEAARQQRVAHYASAQQQQQAYGQAPHGYGYPPGLQPGYGQPPVGAPPIGYGAIPPPMPGQPTGPPVRHPPLPPDQQNPPV
jgi:hypothetical protein